jgi:hypothetical protein
MGFDMDSRVRSDAMWFASSVFQPLEHDLTHPTRIRQWFNENQQASPLPEELQTITIETRKVPSMDTRTAATVGKLVRRAGTKVLRLSHFLNSSQQRIDGLLTRL